MYKKNGFLSFTHVFIKLERCSIFRLCLFSRLLSAVLFFLTRLQHYKSFFFFFLYLSGACCVKRDFMSTTEYQCLHWTTSKGGMFYIWQLMDGKLTAFTFGLIKPAIVTSQRALPGHVVARSFPTALAAVLWAVASILIRVAFWNSYGVARSDRRTCTITIDQECISEKIII